MGFPLTDAQRRAVDNVGGPLLVSAAAGAGKTRVLVERLLDRVEQGADVDQFLIITFTNAAAAELRERIGDELGKVLAQRPMDRHLRRQVNLVYSAHISTIHSFCQDFLRQWGHLIDLDPDFRLCDAGESQVLLQEALEEVLEKQYEAPTPEFALLLEMFAPGRDDGPLGRMAVDIFQKLQGHPDPAQWLTQQEERYRLEGVADAAKTPWGEYLLARFRGLAGYWYDQLEPLYQECREGVAAYCPSLLETLEGLKRLRSASTWDDAAAPEFPRLGSSAKCKDPDLAERVKGLRESCKRQFNKVGEPLGCESAALLRDMRAVAPAVVGLLKLAGRLGEEFGKTKERRGVVDFNDLEHLTLRLLEEHPEAAREVSERLVEVMVDEYQDTNQVQNAIFSKLTADRGNLFMVGDVKQSIYRFRLADPTIFLEKYKAYPNASDAAPGQGRRVILGENFRSRREVIDCVNYLFENLMSEDLGELDYGPEEALRPGVERPSRDDCAAELHLLANPTADEDGDNSMTEPRFVARRLAQLVAEGFPVEDGHGGTRPVQPGDMAVLLRAPNRVVSRYVRALYEVGLPWASEGGEDFLESPEVAVALSYLEVIDNPRQDVPLIAVLRSPLYGLTPDQLAELKAQKGEGCFYDALQRWDGQSGKTFLTDLEELRLLCQDKKSYELLWDIYCRKGLLFLYPEERRGGLLALYGWARKFEGSGHKGLFGFLTHLRRRREQGETLTTPAVGGEGVQILSIHRSKGLEYPVVVVAGLGKRFNHLDSRETMLFHRTLGLGPKGLDPERMIQYPTLARWAVAEKLEEEMRGEELRLLYVALTRAREKLIMTCAMKDPEREVDKLLELAKLPPDPEGLRQLDTLGHWVLSAALCRPEGAALRQGMALRHTLPAEAEFGMRWRMELHGGGEYQTPPRLHGGVTAGQAGPVAGPLPDYTWRYPYAPATALPSKLTATQLKGRELDREAEEDAAQRRPVLFDRPDFAEEKGLTPGERGTAHHVVMQFLDFSKTDSLEAIDGDIRRLVDRGIVAKRQGDAVDRQVIWNFFRSPLGQEVLAAGDGLHREFKFSVLEPAHRYFSELGEDSTETVLLQGVVDCWFDTPEGLVIVDFKSDRVTTETVMERAAGYQPQLEAYATALGHLLGRPVRRRVLWFFALSEAVELPPLEK